MNPSIKDQSVHAQKRIPKEKKKKTFFKVPITAQTETTKQISNSYIQTPNNYQ